MRRDDERAAGERILFWLVIAAWAVFLLASIGCAGTTIGVFVQVDGHPERSWTYQAYLGEQDTTWRCPDKWAEVTPGVPVWLECPESTAP